MELSRLFGLACLLVLVLLFGCANGGVYISGYSEAQSFQSEGEYRSAIEQYEAYIQKHPDSPLLNPVLYEIGKCYEALGNKHQAVTYYQKIIEAAPDSEWADFSKDNLKRLEGAN